MVHRDQVPGLGSLIVLTATHKASVPVEISYWVKRLFSVDGSTSGGVSWMRTWSNLPTAHNVLSGGMRVWPIVTYRVAMAAFLGRPWVGAARGQTSSDDLLADVSLYFGAHGSPCSSEGIQMLKICSRFSSTDLTGGFHHLAAVFINIQYCDFKV